MHTSLRTTLIAVAAVSLLATGGVVAQSAMTKNPAEVQAGDYALDASHGRITWKVNHLGFSSYVGQFTNVKAELKLDPANPANSSLTAVVPITDVAPNDEALKRHLLTADFFDAATYPVASFTSTSIVIAPRHNNKAEVYGDLNIRGVTKNVKLDVTFNQAGPSMGGQYRAGFDATTTIKRSDFGINYALPALGDDVELHIEGEFVK